MAEETRFTCRHCQELQTAFEFLQEKEAKLRRKFDALNESFAEMKLQIELLQQENRLLKELKSTQPAPSTQPMSPNKVSEVLDGFDDIIENQGHEITRLINDRSRLSTAAFSALSLVSKQEAVINKFTIATEKLMSFIAQRGETATSVSKEFALLGIDTTNELDQLQRRFTVEAATNLDRAPVSDDSVARILTDLAHINADSNALETVTTYIVQQVQEKQRLRKRISSSRARAKSFAHELDRIATLLNVKAQSTGDLRRHIQTFKRSEFLLREVVNVIVKFATRFDDDINVQSCVNRMRRWLENPVSVDIAQEVNFILGLLRTEKL